MQKYCSVGSDQQFLVLESTRALSRQGPQERGHVELAMIWGLYIVHHLHYVKLIPYREQP